jgi:hypothetical protein
MPLSAVTSFGRIPMRVATCEPATFRGGLGRWRCVRNSAEGTLQAGHGGLNGVAAAPHATVQDPAELDLIVSGQRLQPAPCPENCLERRPVTPPLDQTRGFAGRPWL